MAHRFYPLLFAAFLAIACTKNFDDLQENDASDDYLVAYLDEDVSKTYLDSTFRVQWNEGDYIGVFSTTRCYGSRLTVKQIENKESFVFPTVKNPQGTALPYLAAVYPSNGDYWTAAVDSSGTVNLSAEVPASQQYVESSFALRSAVMAAATSSPDDKILRFKHVCGFIPIRLRGAGEVYSIVLKGLSGEKICGPITFPVRDGVYPEAVATEKAKSELTLKCSSYDSVNGCTAGVKLDSVRATTFWMSVIPVEFQNGFTLEISLQDGGTLTISTHKHLSVKRGAALKMAVMDIGDASDGIAVPDGPDNGLILPSTNASSTFCFSSEKSWNASIPSFLQSESSWFDITPHSGAGPEGKISIIASDNTSMVERTGRFLLTAGGRSRYVKVTQQGLGYCNFYSPAVLPFEKGTFNPLDYVKSNFYSSFRCQKDSSNLSWITDKGKYDRFPVNSNPPFRTATAILNTTSYKSYTLPLLQVCGGYLTVNSVSETTDGRSHTLPLIMSTEAGWSYSTDCDWIHFGEKKDVGYGCTELEIKVDKNSSMESRQGVISFTDKNNYFSYCLTITQISVYDSEKNWATSSFAQFSLGLQISDIDEFYKTSIYDDGVVYDFDWLIKKTLNHFNILRLYTAPDSMALSAAQYIKSHLGTADKDVVIDYRNSPSGFKYHENGYLKCEQVRLYGVVSGISYESFFHEDSLTVNMKMYFQKADNYVLYVFLTEDNVFHKRHGIASNGDFYWKYNIDDVARASLTPDSGDSVNVTQAKTIKYRSFSVRLSPKWKRKDLKIVAYILRGYGSRTKKSDGSYGSWYVDNSVCGKAGQPFYLMVSSEKETGNTDNYYDGGIIDVE